jgi:hypothetical protein
MSTEHHDSRDLLTISRADRARFVKEARQLRAREFDRLIHAIGFGLVGAVQTILAPVRRPRAARGNAS